LPLDEADPAASMPWFCPGVINPDTLRTDEAVLGFHPRVDEAGKPVAAICHGPWLLINSGLADGRELTWPSLQQDLANAGRSGAMPRSWSTATSSPAASRMTFRLSARRW
jgi:protease I